MESNEHKSIKINEVDEKNINIIAQYTRSKANAVRDFITANNLDPIKLAFDISKDQKVARNNLALAISGKARVEYLNQIKTKYSINEGVEPLSFWQTKYGEEIIDLANGDQLDEELVKQYLNSLIGNGDPERKHVLNQIALEININPNKFESFSQQIDAMILRLKGEFEIYNENKPLTKGRLNEIIDKVLGMHYNQEIQLDSSSKKYKMTIAQFQSLLPQIIRSKKVNAEIQNANK
jgi:hypothetical protein